MKTTSRLARAAAGVAVLLAVALTSGIATPPNAVAEPPLPTNLPTSRPSPSPPSPSTTPSSKPTARPSPRPTAKPSATPAPTPTIAQPKGPAPTVYNGSIPDAVNAYSVRAKTPSRFTTALLGLLQQLQPPGVPLDASALRRGVGSFPVAGYASYSDDWGAPRYIPYFHLHEGVDIFATGGTQIVACATGTIAKLMVGTIGGVSIWLRADDGTVFYYGHLRAYAPGLVEGVRVKPGDLIGEVGNSGDAVGTPPHVHFEVHPGAGVAVPPKPYLDRWLSDAESAAREAIRRGIVGVAAAKTGAAQWKSLLGLLAEPAPRPAPYWLGALDPTHAAGGFADAALDRIAFTLTPQKQSQMQNLLLSSEDDEGSTLSPVIQDGGVLAAPRAALRFRFPASGGFRFPASG